MSLLTNSFVNNSGRLFGPSEQFCAGSLELGLRVCRNRRGDRYLPVAGGLVSNLSPASIHPKWAGVVEKNHVAAFRACCGAEITRKAEACPVCGTPQHGMLGPELLLPFDQSSEPPEEDAELHQNRRQGPA